LIEDTQGNIFGGFTPVKWESPAEPPYNRLDPSLKTFLFSLKNPHNFPAKKFQMKVEKKNERAIWCDPTYGPNFWDIEIGGVRFATCTGSTAAFGSTYVNDTGLVGETVLAGSPRFTVKEIEIFEIDDSPHLPELWPPPRPLISQDRRHLRSPPS
jgi:hypothetical protein